MSMLRRLTRAFLTTSDRHPNGCINRPPSQRFCTSLKTIREEFRSFTGSGKVTWHKDQETGIAVMKFDHEERRNAISAPMIVNLAEALDDLEAWPTGKGLVLWGGPKTFCSGADLDLVRQLASTTTGSRNLSLLMNHILIRIRNLPLVTVALLTGRALGGGAELASACDFRMMASGSDVSYVHKRMGVITGWGGGPLLVQLVGRTAALEVLLSGKRFSASEAVELGFANGTVASSGDGALAEASNWLRDRVTGAPEVVRSVKQMVVHSEWCALQEAMDFEKQLFAVLFGGPAQQKALQDNVKH